MSVSDPFIQRPIATSLLVAAIVLLGVVAFPLLPISALPQVDFPTISVSAKLPGASPETMAVSVAAPLEKQFAQISGITQMTSSSASGTTAITLQFDLGRDIDGAAQDVQAAITVANKSLPKTLSSPPSYRKVNPADAPIMIVALDSETLPITVVDQYADTILAQQMSQLPGVAQVQVSGEQRPAIRIQVDPVKLASIGISLEDVRAALTSATVNSPKGSFNGSTQTFTIYNNDQLLRAEEYNNVIITYRNGSPIRISDVGHAIDGPEDLHLAGWQNGHRGIQLMVFKQPGANVIETAKGVRAALPRLQTAIPPAIHVSIITDRTQTIRASVDDVEFTMILTVGLVVMVIFLFLRNLWATAIPSITLPITIIGTFAAMYLLNYSLDNVSLMESTVLLRVRQSRYPGPVPGLPRSDPRCRLDLRR